MRRSFVISSACGLLAIFAIVAACRAYQSDGKLEPSVFRADPVVPSKPMLAAEPQRTSPNPPPEATKADVPVPTPPTVDEVLNQLDSLLTRKKAIEAEEKRLRALLEERLQAQKQRLEKLGVKEAEKKPSSPPPPAFSG